MSASYRSPSVFVEPPSAQVRLNAVRRTAPEKARP
jgi:hypothetical protein